MYVQGEWTNMSWYTTPIKNNEGIGTYIRNHILSPLLLRDNLFFICDLRF